MKILFTADLHLNIPARNPRPGRFSFDCFAEAIEREDLYNTENRSIRWIGKPF